MKTLDAIINRGDYKRLNGVLNEKVRELAKILRKKMYELELTEFYGYKIANVHSMRCGYSTDYLACEDEYYYYSLEDDKNYYYCNDFDLYVHAASGKMKLEFLNKYKEIISAIDEYETEKCAEVEKALENLK